MRNFALFFILFFVFSNSNSQDLRYAKYLVEKLASKEFSGRGYVNDGGIKSATFIANQFDSLGLKPLSPDFFQPFVFPVNTFPGENEVTIDGKKLIPGDDYIVYPYSGGGSAKKYKLKKMGQYTSAKIFNKHPDVCYIVLQDSLTESSRSKLFGDLISGTIKSGAIIFLEQKKLTWSVAKDHFSIPVVLVLQYFVPGNAKDVTISVSQEFIPEFKTQNVTAYIPGKVSPDSFIVFSAHYDHLGMMGPQAMFPGANDNASGVSMILNLAAHYSKKENQPECSIAFIGFAGEEAGLIGSEFYTKHPLFDLSQIKFLINLDLLGTGEEGMMVVNATEFPRQFQLLDSLNKNKNYLVKLGQRGKAKNSDHYYFSEQGVPSFFFYTMGGIQAYHDINDKAETLPLTEFEDVFRLIIDFTRHLR